MTATILHVTFGANPTVQREAVDELAQRAEQAFSETLELCEQSGVPHAMAMIQASAAARTAANPRFDPKEAVRRAHDRAVRGTRAN